VNVSGVARRVGQIEVNGDAAGLVRIREGHGGAEHDRAGGAIGVDPERVGHEREGRRRLAEAGDLRAGRDPRQGREQARVLRVQVLEQEALVGADRAELLIRRRAVEERGIDVVREGAIGGHGLRPARSEPRPERGPLRPAGRDGREARGLERVAAAGDVGSPRLQIREPAGA
jgi:hypothetical protein